MLSGWGRGFHLDRPAIGILLLLLYSAGTDARWLYQTFRIAYTLPPTA